MNCIQDLPMVIEAMIWAFVAFIIVATLKMWKL